MHSIFCVHSRCCLHVTPGRSDVSATLRHKDLFSSGKVVAVLRAHGCAEL